jgi:hypothetical protein
MRLASKEHEKINDGGDSEWEPDSDCDRKGDLPPRSKKRAIHAALDNMRSTLPNVSLRNPIGKHP